jgi:hypothetical protein
MDIKGTETSPYFSPSVSKSVHQCIHQFVHNSVTLSVCQFVRQSVFLNEQKKKWIFNQKCLPVNPNRVCSSVCSACQTKHHQTTYDIFIKSQPRKNTKTDTQIDSRFSGKTDGQIFVALSSLILSLLQRLNKQTDRQRNVWTNVPTDHRLTLYGTLLSQWSTSYKIMKMILS